jgi:hypothetical protein
MIRPLSPDPSFFEGLQKAQEYFQKERLAFPEISEEQKSKIKILDESVFGTKSNPHSLYDITAYVQEFLSQPINDYVMLGYGGHGVGSRGIHYYAVKGQLALFIQLSYDSAALVDFEAARERVDGILEGIGYLFESVNTAAKEGLFPENKKLLIIQSDFFGNGWGWIEGHPQQIDEKKWNTEEPVILNALMDISNQ